MATFVTFSMLRPVTHRALTHCVAWALDVRRIREQRQNALLAKLAEAGKVDDLAVDGRRVDLEVARVDNGAKACVDGERDRVRDGVVRVNELDAETAQLDGVARADMVQLDLLGHLVLGELGFDDAAADIRHQRDARHAQAL